MSETRIVVEGYAYLLHKGEARLVDLLPSDPPSQSIGMVLDALASAQAELRDVKKVEAFVKAATHTNYVAWDGESFVAVAAMQFAPNEKATAPTLPALGRMLTEGENG